MKKILIVEGNTPAACEHAQQFGQATQSDNYASTLLSLDPALEIVLTTPADPATESVSDEALRTFDGVVFTGSSLHAYDTEPEVLRQIELMKRCFDTGRTIFGSCWGLQIAVVAAGGQVEPNAKGRELGIARRICLTPSGRAHYLFADKDPVFDAIGIHLDHVTRAPAGADILASNAISDVQAMSLAIGESEFLGVQYHPEFSFSYMSKLFQRYRDMLLSERFSGSDADVDTLISDYVALDDPDGFGLQWRYGIGSGLATREDRLREISNWLASL